MESFFWVLLWIVLRHTNHQHEDDKGACESVFKYGNDKTATAVKQSWLLRIHTLNPALVVIDNAPLTDLLKSFHMLVYTALMKMPAECVPLTYDAVLHIFDAAIARDDWPVGDKAIPYKLTDGRTKHTVVRTQVKTGDEGGKKPKTNKRTRPTLEDDGVQSDSDSEVESKRTKTAGASTSRARGSRGSGNPSRKGGSGRGSKASGSKGKKGSGVRDVGSGP